MGTTGTMDQKKSYSIKISRPYGRSIFDFSFDSFESPRFARLASSLELTLWVLSSEKIKELLPLISDL
jgi:hypothetical protein